MEDEKKNKVHHVRYPLLILFILALVFLSVALTIFIQLNQQMKNDLLKSVQREEKAVLFTQTNRVKELIGYLITDLTNLAQREEIKKGREKDIRPLLNSFYQRHQEVVVAGYFMDKRGILKFVEGRDRSGEGKNISYQTHIKELFRTKRPVVSISFMAVEGYISIAIHSPIVINEKIQGSIATLIKWKDLADWLKKPIVLQESFFILLDPKGKIVCHPVSQYIGNLVTDMKDTYFEGHLSWKEILSPHSIAGVGKGSIFGKERHIFATYPIVLGNKNYSLINAIPYSSVAGFIGKYYTLSRTYLVLSFLVIFLIISYAGWIFYWDKRKNLILEKELKEDIEKRKNLEGKLKRSNELKTKFLSEVSHEIATPLTSLQDSLSLLFDDILGRTNSEQKKFLAIASQSVSRLSRLIDDLLDISRIEAGIIRVTPQPLNIAVLARGVVKTILSSAEKKGIKLSSQIPFYLSPVMADHDRTIQILTNLISNSIKYTPKGKIELIAEEKEDFLEVAVIDTGIGIPPEEREKIFNHFYQIRQYRSDGSPGRGLGLSIIRAIVERQGGKIWVESEPGKGSKFTFTVPVVFPSSFQDLLDEAIRFGEEEGKMFTLFRLGIEETDQRTCRGRIYPTRGLDKSSPYESKFPSNEFKKELELLLKEMMRHSIDSVSIYQDKIGMLIYHLLEGKIEPFIFRLKSTIKKHKFSQFPVSLKLSYRIAWAHFPEEGRNAETLIKKIEDKRGITF